MIRIFVECHLWKELLGTAVHPDLGQVQDKQVSYEVASWKNKRIRFGNESKIGYSNAEHQIYEIMFDDMSFDQHIMEMFIFKFSSNLRS